MLDVTKLIADQTVKPVVCANGLDTQMMLDQPIKFDKRPHVIEWEKDTLVQASLTSYGARYAQHKTTKE